MAPLTFTATQFNGKDGVLVIIPFYPSVCPTCHTSVDPIHRGAWVSGQIEGRGVLRLEVVYQCTVGRCRRLFIGEYSLQDPTAYHSPISLASTPLKFDRVWPKTTITHEFSDEILSISERFPLIYNQAAAAETAGLDEIAGVGYGKALEFLIKDYLIAQAPDDAAQIKKEFLGTVLKRVQDGRISAVATRATWLRNDETHYERRWMNRDIEDLKKLIRLAVNWIESSILTADYEKEMPGKDTPK